MSEEKHTLPLRLTTAQKATVAALARSRSCSRNALVISALAVYCSRLQRTWPASPPDLRKRTQPPKPLPPLPKIPASLNPLECRDKWLTVLEEVAAAPSKMNEETWRLMLAYYRAAREPARPYLWRVMDQHRALIEKGQPLPAKVAEHRRMLIGLWRYEQHRKKWSQRNPVDRSKLSPERLERKKAGDRQRAHDYRARRAAEKERAFQEAAEELCSPYDEGSIPQAAE
jgi:hypothetical protein